MLQGNAAVGRLCKRDPSLRAFRKDLVMHMQRYYDARARLGALDTPLSDVANGYLYFGFHQIGRAHV